MRAAWVRSVVCENGFDKPTVAGISNAVLVSASIIDPDRRETYHSMAMTVDQGTNHYWGWGDLHFGAVGNGTNDSAIQYTPAQARAEYSDLAPMARRPDQTDVLLENVLLNLGSVNLSVQP